MNAHSGLGRRHPTAAPRCGVALRHRVAILIAALVVGIPAVAWPPHRFIKEVAVAERHAAQHWPATVALIEPWASDDYMHAAYRCAGVQIEATRVATAAHCVAGRGAVDVVGGAPDLCRPVRSGARQMVTEDRIVVHPGYSSGELSHDVAVLHLSVPLRPTPPPVVHADTGDMAVVVGYGPVERHRGRSCAPVAVPVRVARTEGCGQPAVGVGRFDAEWMLCGYGLGMYGHDACPGDSGGPLLYWNGSSRRVGVAALVSFGVGCGSSSRPGTYADLWAHRDWLGAEHQEGRRSTRRAAAPGRRLHHSLGP
jgi:secreted trypsin-like serine protease